MSVIIVRVLFWLPQSFSQPVFFYIYIYFFFFFLFFLFFFGRVLRPVFGSNDNATTISLQVDLLVEKPFLLLRSGSFFGITLNPKPWTPNPEPRNHARAWGLNDPKNAHCSLIKEYTLHHIKGLTGSII